jgi:hypothetical protein
VRPRHGNRIGLTALVDQALPLALPDPELLGHIVSRLMFRLARRGISIAHGVPA